MTRPRQTITHLKTELLTAHPGNIRDDLGDLEDLARSIREHGILQPITVTEHRLGGFLILAGHRRFAAGRLFGLESFPAIIRHGLESREEQLIVMLVENTQRRDLGPLEKANAFQALINMGLNQSEIARRVGCHPATVNRVLAFLELDETSQQLVAEGRVTLGEAHQAVIEARQERRHAVARPSRGRPPSYFGKRHRLHRVVAAMCSHDGPKVGEAGCGPCWEKTIVDDHVQKAATP